MEVNDLSEVGCYIVYISLDYLSIIFADMGIECEGDKQEKFINEMQRGIGDVLSNRKPGILYSWMWRDADGTESYAVKAIPVASKSEGVTIVTPDVTGYNELADRMAKLEAENYQLKSAINELREEKRRLNNRIDSAILDTCNPADWR